MLPKQASGEKPVKIERRRYRRFGDGGFILEARTKLNKI
jgi:hypothetical protein